MRVAGPLLGLLGGLCWVARWGATSTDGDPGWGPGAHWAGLAALGLALAVLGAGLVSRSALWLTLLVALACPMLVWSVYAVVSGEAGSITVDGVLGTVAVLGGAVLLVRARRSAPHPARGRHGSHAAR